MTSSYFEGDRSCGEEDLRRYGYSRDLRPERRQIVLGLVLSGKGLPLAHHVFPGDRPDKKCVAEVVRDLKERFGIRRAVFVGDRGLISQENLESILDADFDYLMSLPLRHSRVARKLLEDLEGSWKKGPQAKEQVRLEEQEGGLRYAVAFDPEIARESRQSRQMRLEKAQRFIQSVLERLRGQSRGRPLTPQGALEQIHDYLRDRKLLRYFRLELTSRGLSVTADEDARRFEELSDGKLVVESSCGELGAQELIERYKELADIERAFRTLKSSLKIRPVYHWTERRIRAHVFICVLALQLHRFMRAQLAGSGISVERFLERLKTVKAGTLRMQAQEVPYLTALTQTHKELYEQLELPFPKVKDLSQGAL